MVRIYKVLSIEHLVMHKNSLPVVSHTKSLSSEIDLPSNAVVSSSWNPTHFLLRNFQPACDIEWKRRMSTKVAKLKRGSVGTGMKAWRDEIKVAFPIGRDEVSLSLSTGS